MANKAAYTAIFSYPSGETADTTIIYKFSLCHLVDIGISYVKKYLLYLILKFSD